MFVENNHEKHEFGYRRFDRKPFHSYHSHKYHDHLQIEINKKMKSGKKKKDERNEKKKLRT